MKPFDYAAFGEEAGAALTANAVRLDAAAAFGLRPPPKMTVAEWAERYRRFPEESAYPGKWRHDTAPYLVEIMEALSPDDPCEEVAIKKCAQSGGTAGAENWIGHVSDVAPGPMMYVQATFRAALEWADEKLWPMIEATPRLSPAAEGTIRPNDGTGSTKLRLRFRRGGFLLLAGANSAPSLRQHTMRYVIEDDLDQFPDDLAGQGSPEGMIDNRLKVYKRRGLSKRAKISTPTIKGASKIDAAYQASDRRQFYFACPHCASRFAPAWSDLQWPAGHPAEAVLIPPCCGAEVLHWQKAAMTRADGWLATNPAEGQPPPRHMDEAAFQALRAAMPAARRKGYWIGGLITAFQTWADMAQAFVDAQGDVNKLKTWTNLDFGDVFELKGAVPDHDLLKGLREQDWGRLQMPAHGLHGGPAVVTMGVDVQGDGVYYEICAWGARAESWSLDAGFVVGATDVAGQGAWADLDALAKRPIAYPGGTALPIDQICVDAGYHTAAAEAFCRGHANRLPVFGRAGWTLPVLGRGENLRYTHQGRRAGQPTKRTDDKAYIVGTFGVKASFHGFLRAMLAAVEEARRTGLPPATQRGWCHFSRDAPDQWFEQVTAEAVAVKVVNGQPRRVWEVLPGRPNHWLDCRVYNHAAAEKLLLDTLTEADWARLKADRYAAPAGVQGDLLALPIAPPGPRPETNAVRPAGDWINPTNEGWL